MYDEEYQEDDYSSGNNIALRVILAIAVLLFLGAIGLFIWYISQFI